MNNLQLDESGIVLEDVRMKRTNSIVPQISVTAILKYNRSNQFPL